MNHRCWMLGVAIGLGLANVGLASGGRIRAAHDGHLDFIYAFVPPGANDRAITRYGREGFAFPNGSEFDPNSVICGARTRSGHQSTQPGTRPERLDVRLEDPNNPGFPDVLPVPPVGVGTISPTAGLGADSNTAPVPCPQSVAYQNYTFNNGLGVNDPLVATFLTWKFEDVGSMDPCYLGLELFSSPGNGRAKYYYTTGAIYGPLTFAGTAGNHWLEMNVFTPNILDLEFRMHGSPQFAGDRSIPLWFFRGNSGGTTDDFMTTTIVVSNGTGGPISNQVLTLVGDGSGIGLPTKNAENLFRTFNCPGFGPTLGSGNPYSWSPGRTVLRAALPGSIPAKFASKLNKVLPANLPFIARTGPSSPPGPFDDERQDLGLRPHRGVIDDGSAEVAFIVQSPVITGDVLSQRFPLTRLFPRSGVQECNTAGTGTQAASISVSNMTVGAVSNGGAGGFDAIELRRDDPVIRNSADQSPQGRLGGSGLVGDGSVGAAVPVDPNGLCALFEFAQAPSISVNNTADVWFEVYPFPGDTVAGASFLCQDTTADTVIGQSFFSPGPTPPSTNFFGRRPNQPYNPDPTGNWISRLIFSTPFTGPGTDEYVPQVLRQNGPLRTGTAGEIPKLNRRNR